MVKCLYPKTTHVHPSGKGRFPLQGTDGLHLPRHYRTVTGQTDYDYPITSQYRISQSSEADAGTNPRESRMTGESILVVEDQGFIALQIRELLEKNGYRVSGTRHTGRTPLQW